MARTKTPGGKRVTICAKFSEAEEAAIDAARGTVNRSEWLRRAALAAARRRPSASAPGARGQKVIAEPPPSKPDPAPPEPATVRRYLASCPHRLPSGAWCKTCGRSKG